MPTSLQPGTVLQNRYRITRLLGEGGMGAVYQAFDLRLQGHVLAVKENFDNSPTAQAQFQTEAALLANLNHPTLPRVTDHFIEASGRQYLVMDFIEGDDLEKIVVTRGRIHQAQAIAWISHVLDGLEYLHSHRPAIIHRDIKPANIKIRPDGRVFLVDFGIAKMYDPTQKTQAGARAVTCGYSPIEQYGFGVTDARSDLYSVGATLYFMLTAQILPEATLIASNPQALVPPSRYGATISQPVEAAILRALAMSPQYRFQSAREFRDALNPQAATQARASSQTVAATALAPTAGAYPNVAPPAQAIPAPQPLYRPTPLPAHLTHVTLASWGSRAVAYLLDWFLLSVAFVVALVAGIIMDATIAGAGSRSYGSSSSACFTSCCQCLWILLVPFYFVFQHSHGGQTIGKKALGIKIVQIKNGATPDLGVATLRLIGYWISGLILYLGFLWPLWDDQKQALHDKIAGTLVIRT